MVKASNVDLSLDDIISKTRKSRGTIAKRPIGGAKRGVRRPASSGGFQRRRQSGNGGWRDFDAPGNADIVSAPGGNRITRLNISNLAPSVIASDLDELFVDFGLETAVVNYNEHGESLGTADLTLRKRDADNLIKRFAGIALDGKVMKFALINSTNIAGRVDFGARRFAGGARPRASVAGGRKFVKKTKPEDFLRDGVHTGGETRRGGNAKRGGKGGKRGGEGKPQKTEAELDAELEAYMSKRKS